MSDDKGHTALQQKLVRKAQVRRPCGYCGEDAVFRQTYLNDGPSGARRNPQSSAYRMDDCSWCSDFDDYLCEECAEKRLHDNAPAGYGPCSRFAYPGFPHMFLEWKETEVLSTEANILRAVNCHEDLVKALEGVIAVADRKTDEFDRAKAILARAKDQTP